MVRASAAHSSTLCRRFCTLDLLANLAAQEAVLIAMAEKEFDQEGVALYLLHAIQ